MPCPVGRGLDPAARPVFEKMAVGTCFLNLRRCGGRKRPPYGTGETWRLTGKTRPHVITNLCRGRCLHRPATPAPPQTPAGGPWPPYRPGRTSWPTVEPHPRVITNLCRGRCSHRPADLAPPRAPAGGINPAPTNGGKARGQPGKREPGNVANLCRGRFHIGPVCGGAGFHGRVLRPKSRRCVAVGLRNAPAGAVNPAPTNKFYVLGQPGQPQPRGRP